MKILKRWWLWIGILLVIIIAVIFDLILFSFSIIKTVQNTAWSKELLTFTGIVITLAALTARYKVLENSNIHNLSKVLLLFCVVWVFSAYPLKESIYFTISILALTKVISLFIPRKKNLLKAR